MHLVGAATKVKEDVADLLTEHPRELKLGGSSGISLDRSEKRAVSSKVSSQDIPKKTSGVVSNVARTNKSTKGSNSRRAIKL